jgi:hypothetical protein
MLLINNGCGGRVQFDPRRHIMNPNRKPFDATGPQARQLTEFELENVSGGTIKKTTDSSSPAFFKNSVAGSKLP